MRGLSSASWYNDFIKAAKAYGDDHPPRSLRRPRNPKPVNNHQPLPKGDKARMEQVCRIVDIYRQGWLTPTNATVVLKDILKG